MKKTPETLQAICATIAGGDLSQASAARRSGISVATFWSWIAQSQKNPDDPEFLIEFCEEQISFAKAVALSRRIGLHEVVGKMERRAIEGDRELIFFQGRPSYMIEEDAEDMSPDMRELWGYHRDGFKHDPYTGARMQHYIQHSPPVALTLAVAAANFPKIYGAKSELKIEQRVSLGVSIQKTDYSKPAAIAAPLLALQVIEEVADAVAITAGENIFPMGKIDPLDEPAELTFADEPPEPEPEPVPELEPYVLHAEHDAPEPERAVSTDTTRPMAAAPAKQLSALERDLLSRLKQPHASPARVQAPNYKAPAFDDDDTNPARTGHGPDPAARPGGVKVA